MRGGVRSLQWDAYWRLARLHKPVGILLLGAPTAWALWLANHGNPSFKLVLIFLLGTVLMRSAGCIVNDIADRQFDIHVKRTQARPLTTGEVSLYEAIGVLAFFLLASLVLLLQLPALCWVYAIAALLVTLLYPLCKRFMHAPQLVLGVAFSMGIPMAYTASGVPFDRTFLGLCLINFCWILAYDTQYAMVDKEDDLRICVHSTAIYLGQWDKFTVNALLALTHLFWLILGIELRLSFPFYIAWGLGLVLLAVEYRLIALRDPKECFRAFSLNTYYGLLMWFGILFASH